VIWRITDRCDMSCAHCGSHDTADKEEALDTEAMLAIAKKIADAGVQSVVLSGGEPLLRNDWRKIAEALAENEVGVSLVSNGNDFDADTAQWCYRYGFRAVHLSLDGAKEHHNRQRKDDSSYDKVIAAITNAKDVNLGVAVVTTITRFVVDDLEELQEVLAENEVDHWQIRIAARQPGNHLTNLDYLRPEEIPPLVERLKELAMRPDGPELFAATSIGYYGELETALRDTYADSWRGCTCGIDWCTIEPDGGVKACGNTTAIEGNLVNDDFLDVWHKDAAFAHTRSPSLADLGGGCRSCEWARLCGGGCLAVAATKDGLRETHHCMQHPDTGGPRDRPGLLERRRVKKLLKRLD
jgi:radical SAM protein with 4Fe4S-binding SPASM domain